MLEKARGLSRAWGASLLLGQCAAPTCVEEQHSSNALVPKCLQLTIQHLTLTEGSMQKPDYRVWQVDDLQLSTARPRSLSHNLDTILYQDMANFSAKGEGLWRNFMKWPPWLHMIPDMGHTPGLGERNTLPSTTVMVLLSLFQSLGASLSSGPEWDCSCETALFTTSDKP